VVAGCYDAEYDKHVQAFNEEQNALSKGRLLFGITALFLGCGITAVFKTRAPLGMRSASAISPLVLLPLYFRLRRSTDPDNTILLNDPHRKQVSDNEARTRLQLAGAALSTIVVLGALFKFRLPESLRLVLTLLTAAIFFGCYWRLPYIHLTTDILIIDPPPDLPPEGVPPISHKKVGNGDMNESIYHDAQSGPVEPLGK
jgi:hypothetical protein